MVFKGSFRKMSSELLSNLLLSLNTSPSSLNSTPPIAQERREIFSKINGHSKMNNDMGSAVVEQPLDGKGTGRTGTALGQGNLLWGERPQYDQFPKADENIRCMTVFHEALPGHGPL